jgi:hypothetical protein
MHSAATSTVRAAWLGARLAEQVARGGVGGVVGDHRGIDGDGKVVKLSEYARRLTEREFRERQHVASLAERIARLGLDAGAQDRDVARRVRSYVGLHLVPRPSPEVTPQDQQPSWDCPATRRLDMLEMSRGMRTYSTRTEGWRFLIPGPRCIREQHRRPHRPRC